MNTHNPWPNNDPDRTQRIPTETISAIANSGEPNEVTWPEFDPDEAEVSTLPSTNQSPVPGKVAVSGAVEAPAPAREVLNGTDQEIAAAVLKNPEIVHRVDCFDSGYKVSDYDARAPIPGLHGVGFSRQIDRLMKAAPRPICSA